MTLPRIARWLGRLALVLLVLAFLGLVVGVILVRSSFPKAAGVMEVPGLQDTVDIYRSPDGVPTIYAANEHDLFFAQGYVHAQDRFWQMDLSRHIGSGRLSQLTGASQTDTDAFLRTLGWERIAEQEWEMADADTRAILQAYADGVNAYIADRNGPSLSLEFVVIGLINPAYQIEPWTPVNTLTWGKVMSWDLGGNMDGEIVRALMLQSLTPDQLDILYPAYPDDFPIIVPGSAEPAQAGNRPASTNVVPAALPGLELAAARVEAVNDLLGAGFPGIGSNSWVVTGERSASGGAMLVNDTHLGIQMPSIWYENSLQCRPAAVDCRFNVAGFSFAGVPGVIIGHNQDIAWGVTNLGPDVQDLYIERINPDNPNQYEFEGAWRDMELIEDQILISGADPVPLTIRRTHHGPIITDTYGALDEWLESAAGDLPEHYAIALQWTGLQPSNVFQVFLEINQATNWDGFRSALAHFDVPAQNFVFADADGNIGYQMPGHVPIRRSGDGWLPVPGWTGEYEWDGFIPFDELPSAFAPESGYIITANHAVVDESYDYFISRGWTIGYRAGRIETLIEQQSELDLEDMAAIQGDNQHPMAAVLIPVLSTLEFEDPRHQAWADRLGAWDGQNDSDSPEAALFNTFWRHLLIETFTGDWLAGPIPTSSRGYLVIQQLVADEHSPWWDSPEIDGVQSRDDVFLRAFTAAFSELESRLGSDPEDWQWGQLHTSTFRNRGPGESGIGPIEAIFNRGPFPTSGGTQAINATNWTATRSFEVTSLPSQRFQIDMSDLDGARTIHTTGQSGHAFHPNYIDLADRWRSNQTHALPWTLEAVVEQAALHLRLQPE